MQEKYIQISCYGYDILVKTSKQQQKYCNQKYFIRGIQ